MKNCVIFLSFAQNIDRTSTHNLCFRAKNKKIIRGSSLHGLVFVMNDKNLVESETKACPRNQNLLL